MIDSALIRNRASARLKREGFSDLRWDLVVRPSYAMANKAMIYDLLLTVYDEHPTHVIAHEILQSSLAEQADLVAPSVRINVYSRLFPANQRGSGHLRESRFADSYPDPWLDTQSIDL